MKVMTENGFIAQGALVASVAVAAVSILSFVVAPMIANTPADMYIVPGRGDAEVDDIFTVDVMVASQVPVNVFKGEVLFDPRILKVESIDYNTSIADLWAELPWYENGEGSINFAGGTTQSGGFQGTGSLIRITFRTIEKGITILRLDGARILAHDGFGTDVPVNMPLDAIFEVEERIAKETVATPKITTTALSVATPPPSTDLNGDGKQSIADVSIFVRGMFGDEPRFDFNQDGKVDTKDLSILMSAK